MNHIAELYRILEDPAAYGRLLKERGGRKIVGTFCSYLPGEIIYAAGAHPFRLFGMEDQTHLADAHFQSYCCSLVRGALGGALAGGFDFLDGIVFPHTCDSIQRLSDIWRMNIRGPFHLDVVLPVKLDTKSAAAYMADILQKFRRDLGERLQTDITDDRLRDAVRTFNAVRRHLKRLYELKAESPGSISGSDLHAVVKGSMMMDRSRLLEVLPAVVAAVEERRAGESAASGRRLVLAGGVCTQPDIYRIIEEAGGMVVWDDFCTGSRYFETPAGEQGDPVAAIAKRLLQRPVCPAKHAGLYARGENLLKIVKEQHAEGVVFLLLKFCDPHAFDYPYMKEMLDREGIPAMVLDLEDRLSPGQLQTRFEAFVEMLNQPRKGPGKT